MSSTFDDHRSTVSTVRAPTDDETTEPASPPFPPRTPDRGFSGRSISLGLQCFCGNTLDSKRKSGMFCSMDCARNGTFSSLTTQHRVPSIGTHLMEALTFKDQPHRAPSSTSDYYDEASPHPRAMARADQRREERRRRRADPIDVGVHSPVICRSSTCPNMPSSNTNPPVPPMSVPDLISCHSRSTSTASSIFSFSSSSSLSRVGSTSSHHRQPSSVSVAAAIMEVDGEDLSEKAQDRSTLKARNIRRRPQGLVQSAAYPITSSSSDLRVHDMLDELISMEQSFSVDDHSEHEEPDVPKRVSTPVFNPLQYPQHPPRTPSPVNNGANPTVPPAPGGGTERRNSLSHSRPCSSFAHQSSLSESHTALYLATASPIQSGAPDDSNRRSASPKLTLRRSIQFSPSHAGPIIPPSPRSYDSPSRRKPAAPGAAMDVWRFPKTEFNDDTTYGHDDDDYDMPEPAGLLWPQSSSSTLGQSAFPTSRASMNLAELASNNAPPRSGMRLNMLLGSSTAEENADVDMESEMSDDRSTVRGSIRQSFVPPPSLAQRGW